MCHINILLKRSGSLKNSHTSAVSGFISQITALSHDANPHGDGCFFSSGLLVKSVKKINYANYREQFKESDHIISHQRYATSGSSEDVHPFVKDDFVLAHNGVVQSFAKDKSSDTINMFESFLTRFKKTPKTKSRSKRIYEACKCVFNGIQFGSYSIALYDTIDKELYYFKNTGKNIFTWWSENYMYMSTSKSNGDFLYMLKEEFVEQEIESGMFYKITVDADSLFYEEVGKIGFVYKKVKETTQKLTYGSVDPYGYNQKSLEKRVYDCKANGFCSQCRAHTTIWDPILGDFICSDCIQELQEDNIITYYGDKSAEEETFLREHCSINWNNY